MWIVGALGLFVLAVLVFGSAKALRRLGAVVGVVVLLIGGIIWNMERVHTERREAERRAELQSAKDCSDDSTYTGFDRETIAIMKQYCR